MIRWTEKRNDGPAAQAPDQLSQRVTAHNKPTLTDPLHIRVAVIKALLPTDPKFRAQLLSKSLPSFFWPGLGRPLGPHFIIEADIPENLRPAGHDENGLFPPPRFADGLIQDLKKITVNIPLIFLSREQKPDRRPGRFHAPSSLIKNKSISVSGFQSLKKGAQ